MTTSIRDDPVRMGRRQELLSRILRVVADSPFDGVLGTADIVDELLMISHMAGRASPSRFLNKKVIIGSVNRGGLSGSAFELDDKPTGYDVDGIVSMNLDGAKFLLRVDLADRDSAETIGYCVQTVAECNRQNLPVFVEPLPISLQDKKKRLERGPPEAHQARRGRVGAGQFFDEDTWLKLPYSERFAEVAKATTLPILLLGGEANKDVRGLLREIEAAMSAGPNVRGVLLGRSLLYPPDEDPLPVAFAIHSIVHHGMTAAEAEARMEGWEKKEATPLFAR